MVVSILPTPTSPPANLVSDDLVISEGTFTGANGLVNWRVETRLDDGIAKVFNKVFLTSAQPLGNIRLINTWTKTWLVSAMTSCGRPVRRGWKISALTRWMDGTHRLQSGWYILTENR